MYVNAWGVWESFALPFTTVGRADVEHGSKDHVLKPNQETLDG